MRPEDQTRGRNAEADPGSDNVDDYPQWPNLATMMFQRALQWPDQPMLRSFRDGEWHGITWGQFALMAASAARRLRAAGVSAGDRVMIVSENRPDWCIADLAITRPEVDAAVAACSRDTIAALEMAAWRIEE